MDMSDVMMYRLGVLDAAANAVRRYPGGGLEVIAFRLGKSPETLRKELAGAEGYKLGALDLLQILEWTQDQDLRNALAAHLGGLLMLPPMEEAIRCPFKALGELTEKGGAYTTEIARSFSDGHVSLNEAKRCEAKLAQLVTTAQAAQQLVRASYLAGVPAHERPAPRGRATGRSKAASGVAS
jgi:hypothetical protein